MKIQKQPGDAELSGCRETQNKSFGQAFSKACVSPEGGARLPKGKLRSFASQNMRLWSLAAASEISMRSSAPQGVN